MTDALQPKKRMGRPPKHVGHGKRPAVQLRVRESLYNEISQAAEANGRSMSEEMEARVEYAFSDAVEVSIKAAASEAAEAARLAEFAEIEGDFGGRLTFAFMRQLADAFNAELRKAADGETDYSALFLSDNRRGTFAAAIAEHIPGILKSFGGLAALLAMSNDIGKIIDGLKTNKPEQYQLLVKEFSRVLRVPYPVKSGASKGNKEI